MLLQRSASSTARVAARNGQGIWVRPATSAAGGHVVGIPTASRRPIGGMRGALTGFAIGLGSVSLYGYYYLLQEYHSASLEMRASVRELEDSTHKISAAMARMSSLEKQVGALASSSSTKEDVRSRTGDLVRVYDALHQDVLEVRRKLWDVEQDVNKALGTPTSRQANGRIV
ncbi:hypothetical protein FA10DRAFT_265963, partial [Acaromyces ingoldii]